MRRILVFALGALTCAILVTPLTGSTAVRAEEPATRPNSCAISCPAGSAYPNLTGTVECTEGFAPACQCVTVVEKMASCRRVTATR